MEVCHLYVCLVCGSLPKGWPKLPMSQLCLFLISTRPQRNALLLERLLIHYKCFFIDSSIYSVIFFLWGSGGVDRKHGIRVPFTADCVTFSQSLLWRLTNTACYMLQYHTQGGLEHIGTLFDNEHKREELVVLETKHHGPSVEPSWIGQSCSSLWAPVTPAGSMMERGWMQHRRLEGELSGMWHHRLCHRYCIREESRFHSNWG